MSGLKRWEVVLSDQRLPSRLKVTRVLAADSVGALALAESFEERDSLFRASHARQLPWRAVVV